MSEMTIEHIEKRLKRATCNHSAYKMLLIRAPYGCAIGWVCTQCGLIKRELEADK